MILLLSLFYFQQLALTTPGDKLPITHKCAIQALIATFMSLASQLTAITALCEHVEQVRQFN